MKPSKELLVLSKLTPEQLKAVTPKQFGESKEYFEWKNGIKDEYGNVIQKGIVRKRLELLDQLLSSGEWISNTRMMEEINELYIDAPNEDCYKEPTPPHRLIESKEDSRRRFESALSLMFAGTIRQDRLTINKILRLIGKEYIFERRDKGAEGDYRYNTKYSIFEKHSINQIEVDDYELFRAESENSEEVVGHIESLDPPTVQALQRLSKAIKELRRIRDINNYYVSNLLDKAYSIYDAKRDGWGKDWLNVVLNAYDVASHPDSGFDKSLLFRIRWMLILAKECNSDYSGILALLKKQQQECALLDSVPEGFDEEYTQYLIRHFVFITYDIDGMTRELESYYNACASQGKIILDSDLHFALKCLCFKGPKKWEYNSQLITCVKKLISFFLSIDEDDHFSTGMLVSLFYLKVNTEKAKKEEEPITEDEIIQLYIDNGWEHPMFEV